jgi:hypothetical protein
MAILGFVSLGYLLGAAVMYFELPTSGFLSKAFVGGRAWFERREASRLLGEAVIPAVAIEMDKPHKTCDGFTLYTGHRSPQVTLINMGGDVVHKWEAPFSEVWQNDPPHVPDPLHNNRIGIFGSHLYPNGDLLAVYHANGDTPYGYGLVKLDEDSRVLWRFSDHVHHEVDVGPDGTIYALTQKITKEVPKGFEFLRPPSLVDYLVLISPQGHELKRIPLLEAIRDSKYSLASLLETAKRPGIPARPLPYGDVTHANAVKVLSPNLAAKFPMFKAGQVLISLRELDALVILDVGSRSIAWAVQGTWRRQHTPDFLDNGHLIIFDNLGSSAGSRVLEYDPHTKDVVWSYKSENSEPFTAIEQGLCQRLPNGNTILVDPSIAADSGRILEVTPAKELVWRCFCGVQVPTARRYAPDQLTFLKAGPRP